MQQGLQRPPVVAARAFDHVASERERAAGKADQRPPPGERAPYFAPRIEHVAELGRGVGRRKLADRRLVAQRPFEARPFAFAEGEPEAHGVGKGEDVGKQDRRIERKTLERLQRDLGRQRRRPDELEEAAGPRARSVVLGKIAACLAHQPYRGVLRLLASERPQQRVVLQTSFPMYVHSPAVTGVIESRFPGRSSTIFASGLCLRSSASGSRRVLLSARTSTWNQRGSSFFALGS